MITAARVRELLNYDPGTGIFTWKVKRRSVNAGAVAGSLRPDGRWKIEVDRREYKAHRLAWLYVNGEWPPLDLDHEDNDPSNNRIANLRPATGSQNQGNKRKPRSNTSGYKGVSWFKYKHKDGGKWHAQIMKAGKRVHLGFFDDPEQAHAAYVEAAQRLQGEFARAA